MRCVCLVTRHVALTASFTGELLLIRGAVQDTTSSCPATPRSHTATRHSNEASKMTPPMLLPALQICKKVWFFLQQLCFRKWSNIKRQLGSRGEVWSVLFGTVPIRYTPVGGEGGGWGGQLDTNCSGREYTRCWGVSQASLSEAHLPIRV